MTTIAYKDGVIAYDSRASCGETIVDDDFNKRTILNGVSFFSTGNPSDEPELINHYFGKGDRFNVNCSSIVHDGDKLFLIAIENDKYHKYPIELDKCYAIGSGEDHAWTAMDMGATAKEAIKMAIKRDRGTGGKIRTFELK
jgi:ATP-dependent protease HslVU (ClpYQ) peptidase subunit